MLPLTNALDALHQVLVKTRYLAATGSDSRRIVAILDDAEYLVSLLMHDDVTVDRYKSVLEDMGRKYPEMAGLVVRFDEDSRAILRGHRATALTAPEGV